MMPMLIPHGSSAKGWEKFQKPIVRIWLIGKEFKHSRMYMLVLVEFGECVSVGRPLFDDVGFVMEHEGVILKVHLFTWRRSYGI